MKARTIDNGCLHNSGHLFTIHFTPDVWYSTLTGGESAKLDIFRYCKECREQMGYVEVSGGFLGEEISKELGVLEFTSPEMEEWFKKHMRKK